MNVKFPLITPGAQVEDGHRHLFNSDRYRAINVSRAVINGRTQGGAPRLTDGFRRSASCHRQFLQEWERGRPSVPPPRGAEGRFAQFWHG